MLLGPNFDLYKDLKAKHPDILITVSGGISSTDDIDRLDTLGLPRVIVGKALYEGRVTLDGLSHKYL